MTDGDEKLIALLRQNAPPERDPLFRILVVERLERAAFRRRVGTLVVAALGVALSLAIGVRAGGIFYEALGTLLFALAMIVTGLALAPFLRRLLGRFRL